MAPQPRVHELGAVGWQIDCARERDHSWRFVLLDTRGIR
jgi:hypothetical protein